MTGCMEYLVMRPPAPDTGPAGMELPLNNSASEVCSIMKRLMHVTGLKMWPDVRNIVSVFTVVSMYFNTEISCFSSV